MLLYISVGICEQIKTVLQILCVRCIKYVYGNGKCPRAFFLPLLVSFQDGRPAIPSFLVFPCRMQRTHQYSIPQVWSEFYPQTLEHIDPLMARELLQRASSPGNLFLFFYTPKCICKCPTEGKKLQILHFPL